MGYLLLGSIGLIVFGTLYPFRIACPATLDLALGRFDPLLHSVEWLRSAYYDGYGYGMLNKAYLIGYATAALIGALVIERFTRGLLLQS